MNFKIVNEELVAKTSLKIEFEKASLKSYTCRPKYSSYSKEKTNMYCRL